MKVSYIAGYGLVLVRSFTIGNGASAGGDSRGATLNCLRFSELGGSEKARDCLSQLVMIRFLNFIQAAISDGEYCSSLNHLLIL